VLFDYAEWKFSVDLSIVTSLTPTMHKLGKIGCFGFLGGVTIQVSLAHFSYSNPILFPPDVTIGLIGILKLVPISSIVLALISALAWKCCQVAVFQVQG